jgi:hypothetical protein
MAGGLPGFVRREFEAYLRCGILGHGFARVRCEGCAFERLVPFSCKGRGFCPSWRGRRMTERAAHLSAAVSARVGSWGEPRGAGRLCADAGGVLRPRRRAARNRWRPTGMVTVIQRFGSGVNVNVHFHTLVLDGISPSSCRADSASTRRRPPAMPPWPRCSPRSGAEVAREQIDANMLHGWPPPRAPLSAFSQWGSVCHHVEPGVSPERPARPARDLDPFR